MTYLCNIQARKHACPLAHRHTDTHAQHTRNHLYPEYIEWFTYWVTYLWNNTHAIAWVVYCPFSVSSFRSKPASLLECESNVHRIMLLQLRGLPKYRVISCSSNCWKLLFWDGEGVTRISKALLGFWRYTIGLSPTGWLTGALHWGAVDAIILTCDHNWSCYFLLFDLLVACSFLVLSNLIFPANFLSTSSMLLSTFFLVIRRH